MNTITLTRGVTTIEVSEEVQRIEFGREYSYCQVTNLNEWSWDEEENRKREIYFTKYDDDQTPYADGVYTVPAEQSYRARVDAKAIYIRGTGEAQISVMYEA